MTHPLNKQISTISSSEIYDYALLGVKKFVGSKPEYETLPYFGTHVSLEDLAMDAVEKVVRANPMYITKTYVRIAARCACIDKLKSKKLDVNPFATSASRFQEEEEVNLEEGIEGDITDHLEPLEQLLMSSMDPLQLKIYNELLKNKMYVEIAENLGISLRTLERQVQELKWLCEYLLTEEDPDVNSILRRK
jgi:DNA-directed RNA polymerase specialized sigma24 family protein